jgi:hypothetical protein
MQHTFVYPLISINSLKNSLKNDKFTHKGERRRSGETVAVIMYHTKKGVG